MPCDLNSLTDLKSVDFQFVQLFMFMIKGVVAFKLLTCWTRNQRLVIVLRMKRHMNIFNKKNK